MTYPLSMIIKILWEMITVSSYFQFLISVNNYYCFSFLCDSIPCSTGLVSLRIMLICVYKLYYAEYKIILVTCII